MCQTLYRCWAYSSDSDAVPFRHDRAKLHRHSIPAKEGGAVDCASSVQWGVSILPKLVKTQVLACPEVLHCKDRLRPFICSFLLHQGHLQLQPHIVTQTLSRTAPLLLPAFHHWYFCKSGSDRILAIAFTITIMCHSWLDCSHCCCEDLLLLSCIHAVSFDTWPTN